MEPNSPVEFMTSLALAFFAGSIPFGLIISRFFKVKNLRGQGSGNIGATNVSRVLGFWPAGFITFCLDVAKGALPVLLITPIGCKAIALLFSGDSEVGNCSFNLPLQWAVGLFSILGHCFSPWVHFKGGKGVATGFGVALVLSSSAALMGIAGFILTFLSTRISSLSSIVGLLLTAVAYLALNPLGPHLWLGAAMLFVIFMRHEANIDALLQNKEKSFR